MLGEETVAFVEKPFVGGICDVSLSAKNHGGALCWAERGSLKLKWPWLSKVGVGSQYYPAQGRNPQKTISHRVRGRVSVVERANVAGFNHLAISIMVCPAFIVERTYAALLKLGEGWWSTHMAVVFTFWLIRNTSVFCESKSQQRLH